MQPLSPVWCVSPRIKVKLGPRYELGEHQPSEEDGWTMGPCGTDWAIWEKAAA